MEKTLEGSSRLTDRMAPNSLRRGLGWGLVGGLAGTLAMDLTLIGVLATFGLPAQDVKLLFVCKNTEAVA